jgi:hypothetical protein
MAVERAKNIGRYLSSVIVSRYKIIAIVNLVFFGSIILILSILTIRLSSQPIMNLQPSDSSSAQTCINWFAKSLTILSHNLFNSFVFSFLPGAIFFPAALVYPVLNGLLWGGISYGLTDSQFLQIFPTFPVEGEAIVLAATAGMILGVSRLKPSWLYKDEQRLRLGTFRMALREALAIYLLAILFFVVAALIETMTEYSIVELPL